jgi:hypothetical protein
VIAIVAVALALALAGVLALEMLRQRRARGSVVDRVKAWTR